MAALALHTTPTFRLLAHDAERVEVVRRADRKSTSLQGKAAMAIRNQLASLERRPIDDRSFDGFFDRLCRRFFD